MAFMILPSFGNFEPFSPLAIDPILTLAADSFLVGFSSDAFSIKVPVRKVLSFQLFV